MKKRIISLLLALVMLFGVLPMTALAAGGEDVTQNVTSTEQENMEVGTTPPDSQNKVIKPSSKEEEDKKDEDETEGVDAFSLQYKPETPDYTVKWNQFYGFNNNNGTESGMSDTPDSTQNHFKIFVGSSTTAWANGTSKKQSELAAGGIRIVPETGYYVKQVLIACNDNNGYNCRTAKQDRIARLVAQSTESTTITIDGANLGANAYVNNMRVWHYDGMGEPFYIMVWIAKCPNPVKVIYDDGERTLTGNLVSYDSTKDTLGNTTASFSNNTITFTATGTDDVVKNASHKVLDIVDNFKTVTENSTKYKFAGWKVQIQSEHDENTWEDMSPETIFTSEQIASGSVRNLALYRNYKLVAQWEKDDTPVPEKATITINKVFTDGTNTLPTPDNFVLKIDGEAVNGTNLTYTKELTAGEHTVTEEGYTIAGYDLSSAVLKKGENTITESSKTWTITVVANQNDSYTLTNTYTRTQASGATKEVVCKDDTLPFTPDEGVKLPTKDSEGVIQPILVEGNSVTLLYKITVNGTAGAAFAVVESGDTTKVYPANAPAYDATTKTYTGEVGTDGTFVFYVTRTFDVSGTKVDLTNSIKLGSTDQPNPPVVPYYTPLQLELNVKKLLAGTDLPANYEPTFTLTVKGSGNTASTDTTATAKTTDTTTAVSFTGATLPKVTTPGEYSFVIDENHVENVTKDSRLPITLTYTVALTNGELAATVSAKDKDDNAIDISTDALTLTNTYTAPATSAAVKIKKTFEGLPEGATYPNVSISLKNQSTNDVYNLVKAADSFTYTYSGIPAGTYSIIENNVGYDGYRQKAIRLKDGNGTIEIKESDYGTTVEFELVNVYEKIEKTPATVNFSDLIQKKLTIKGDYIFTGETFHAKMRYKAKEGFGEDAWYEFKAEFGKNTKSGAVKEFVIDSGVGDDGADYIVTFPKAGEYVFYLFEYKDGKSGVTYDTSFYKLTVKIKVDGDKLVLDCIEYSKWNNGDPTGEADKNGYVTTSDPITFYNTVNTGYKSNDHIKIDSPNKLNTDDHYAYIIGYPDGTVQPNGEITRAEVATIFFRLLKDDVREKYFTKTNDFSDVSRDDWFNNPVSTMAELGIVKGYPDGTFRPNEPITRAEFAAIAARFDESSRYGETRFTDVAGHWAIREIAKAYNNGWIKGYPDNTFRPNRNITRAEAMTLINRVLNRAPETEKDLLSNMNKWSDNMDVDAWYYLAVQEATNSHDYRRKSSSYEHWIRMLEDPNWAKYER